MINELTQKSSAIKTAANSAANVFTTVIDPTLVGSAAATATTTVPFSSSIAGLVTSPVLPSSGTTLIAKDVASYTAAILPTSTLTEVAGGTPASYVLQGKVGTGSLTIAANTAGTPFAGNGTVAESVVFTGTDSDKLAITSTTASVNVANTANGNVVGNNTEFGSSVDALNQNRNVVYTNTNQKIASAYSFATKHAFNEDVAGNQAFRDATDKAYAYNDPSINIASRTQTALYALTNFTSGDENLVNKVNDIYNYQDVATQGKTTALNYAVAQVKTSNTVGATTSETTTTNIPNFALVKDGFTLTASGTIVHKQAFNDNGSAVNVANPSTILTTGGTRTQTSDTYDVSTLKVQGGNADFSFNVTKFLDVPRATGTDNTPAGLGSTDGKVLNVFNTLKLGIDDLSGQNFNTSFATAVSDQPGNLKNSFIGTQDTNNGLLKGVAAFTGTADNDNIKVLSTDATKTFIVSAGSGDDLITGHNGPDELWGQKGADTLIGGAGADTLNGGADVDTYLYTAAGETGSVPVAWTAVPAKTTAPTAPAKATVSTVGLDIINDTGKNILDLSKVASTIGTPFAAPVTTTATTFALTGTNTAETFKGIYDAANNLFTSSATGTDTLLVYDNNGTATGGTLEAIVLVGESVASVTGGVFTLA